MSSIRLKLKAIIYYLLLVNVLFTEIYLFLLILLANELKKVIEKLMMNYKIINGLIDKNEVIYYFTVSLFLLTIFWMIEVIFYNNTSNIVDLEVDRFNFEKKHNLLIIIPCYNEEDSVINAINSVKNIGKVLVVDDGSNDNTIKNAKNHADFIIKHHTNFGLSQAIKSGIDFALSKDFDFIAIFDADMQYCPDDLIRLVTLIQKRDYDIVLGSRLAGKIERMPFSKRVGNILFSKAISRLIGTPISDGQTGLRVFKREFAQTIRLQRGFTYTQQMLIEAKYWNFKIAEIPIEFKKRKYGESRLMRNALDFALRAWALNLQIFIRNSPLKSAYLILQFNLIITFLLLRLNKMITFSFFLLIFSAISLGMIIVLVTIESEIIRSQNEDRIVKQFYRIVKE